MHARTYLSWKALLWLTCAALTGAASFGQSSLSILRQQTDVLIHALPPQAAPHTLQASENFHLWIDVTNDLTDPFSLLLDNPRDSSRFFRLIPSIPEAPPIRIMALGDSMIGDCCGWGAGLYGYLRPNATFSNYGVPGWMTWVTLNTNSPDYRAMLLVKPDYVFMDYGVTDLGNNVTAEQFEANLKAIVNLVRSFNGVPFLVTIQAGRIWDFNGKITGEDHPYNLITRRVAAEMNAPLIDVHQITTDLYNRLGPAGSEFMKFTGIPGDVIHLSPLGAVWVSQLVVKGLPDSFGPYLTATTFDPPPNP